MKIKRLQLFLPTFFRSQHTHSDRTQKLQQAINILNKFGFTTCIPSSEGNRDALTIYSTTTQINNNMRGIVEASKTGVLIRCKSEKPEE